MGLCRECGEFVVVVVVIVGGWRVSGLERMLVYFLIEEKGREK